MTKQTTLTGEVETRLVNQKTADRFDIDIGRANGGDSHMNNTEPGEPGWLGNPYPMSHGFSREESIKRFRRDFREKLETDGEFRDRVDQLHGNTLACYCKPKPCHGDVILEYLNGRMSVPVREADNR